MIIVQTFDGIFSKVSVFLNSDSRRHLHTAASTAIYSAIPLFTRQSGCRMALGSMEISADVILAMVSVVETKGAPFEANFFHVGIIGHQIIQ